MRKNYKNKEIFISEFRKKVGNRHFIYKSGDWVEVDLGSTIQPSEPPVHNKPK